MRADLTAAPEAQREAVAVLGRLARWYWPQPAFSPAAAAAGTFFRPFLLAPYFLSLRGRRWQLHRTWAPVRLCQPSLCMGAEVQEHAALTTIPIRPLADVHSTRTNERCSPAAVDPA